MKIYFLKSLCFIALLIFLISCNNTESVAKDEKLKTDSTTEERIKKNKELKKFTHFTNEPGITGLFEVPEMLTLCRKDSSPSSKMPEAFARNFGLLEKDLADLKITSQGAAGSIYYNNDTSNLIFECVYPIADFPKDKPKKSTIVVLEASPMIIYNHYGEYSDLQTAYDNIKKYLNENKMIQSGPMREFYITNPIKVKDHEKWLTRIMVPVMNKK
ncbi:MAG: hypothetical protein JWO32_1830 [Bacteroidetes bacterium]|nr:hypothetical protein [Bacteroidota bacterium]